MTDQIDATIDRLDAAGLLSQYPALAAERARRQAARDAEQTHAAELASAQAMAHLALEALRQAQIPRDGGLSLTPRGRDSSLIICRRRNQPLGVVHVGDDPRPTRIGVCGVFGWATPPEHAAVEPFVAARRNEIGISQPGTPHDDLDALVRSCGFGPLLDRDGLAFLQEFFHAISGMWISSLIARWYATAKTANQNGLAHALRRICNRSGSLPDPEDVLAGRAFAGIHTVPVWPAWPATEGE